MTDSPITKSSDDQARLDFQDQYRELRQHLSRWSIRVDLARKLAIGLTICAAISGIATYAALTGMVSMGANPRTILILLTIVLVLIIALSIIVVLLVV